MHLPFLAAAALVATVVVSPAPALAEGGCASACGAARRICQTAAVSAFRTCRGDARTSGATGSERRAAMHSCRDTFRAAATTCGGALHDCLDACHVPPDTCSGGCVGEGRTCVANVVSAARDCVLACAPGRGRGRCFSACGSQAKSGLDDCRSTLLSCIAGCAGSPSGAFVD